MANFDKKLEEANQAVFQQSESLTGSDEVKGHDFNINFDLNTFLNGFKKTGFQATNLGRAAEVINKMIEINKGNGEKGKDKCVIFLGYTSNMISSGTREVIKYLVQHKFVDVIVTTAGGIEEDLMKCLSPHYIGDFHLSGKKLRKKGHNRIGNLLVPNDNYCKFEDWFVPIIQKVHSEQDAKGIRWTPSKFIKRLGEEINHESSVCYWAAKNNIPVFCPAITDGSIGDMLYFQNYKKPGLVIDVVEDIRRINDIALNAKKTGMIILGGGLVKHHVCNANLMRNGADFSVNINTAQEYDGSDSGASPDEAVSWGKINGDCEPVKVFGDATIIFPLLVAMTFKNWENGKLSK